MVEHKKKPWHPADWELADLKAVQQVICGEADSAAQKRAMAWIINNVCGTYDLEFRPDSERDSAFASGKRFVGLQIIKATKINTAALANKGK